MKGGVNKNKDEGETRLISVNYDSFGPTSNYKIDQVIKEIDNRSFDEIMISSLSSRWGTVIKNIIENELKIINSKLILSTSYRKEEIDKNKELLKGGATVASWNGVVNHM